MKVDQQIMPGYHQASNSFHPCFVSPPQAFLHGEPTSFDILLGKEKAIFNHSGNRKFRAIINSNLEKYIAAPTKSSKTKLIRQVHADMLKSGYRFLRKNEAAGTWNEIESHEAREKVSHALRDRVREQQKPTRRRKKSKKSPPSPTSVIKSEAIDSPEPENSSKPSDDDLSDDKEDLQNIEDEDIKKEDSQSVQDEDMPSLCDDSDGGTNQPLESSSEDPDKISSSENDITAKTVVGVDEGFVQKSDETQSKQERRLSMLSLFNGDDSCLTTKHKENSCSTRPNRRCSLLGIFESLANNGDSMDDEMVDDEPLDHTVDNDINLLEIIHDISKSLNEFKKKRSKQNRNHDAFHTMPIADVYSSEEEAKLVDKVIAL